jgi:hypothetical protein
MLKSLLSAGHCIYIWKRLARLGFINSLIPLEYQSGESEEDFATRLAENLEKLILKEGPETVSKKSLPIFEYLYPTVSSNRGLRE